MGGGNSEYGVATSSESHGWGGLRSPDAIEAVPEAPRAMARRVGGARASRIDAATAFLSRYTSENSRRAMEASLRVVAEVLLGRVVTDVRAVPWEKVRYEHVQAVRSRLTARYSSASANRHLVALRGLMKEAWKLGMVDRDTQEHIQNVESVKHTPRETGRALSQPEISALYAACDPTASGKRDAAILALTVGAGLRRSEVCGLNVEDYERERGRLQVLGKGNKYRTVFLGPKAKAHMASWLEARGPMPGPLVMPMDKYAKPLMGKRLSSQGVYVLLQQLGTRSKVTAFTPHDLRRTFITRLLDKGADALVVSRLAGHANVQTTMRYDKRGERAQEAAVALLDD
jgi:site-specific recombinase XerD